MWELQSCTHNPFAHQTANFFAGGNFGFSNVLGREGSMIGHVVTGFLVFFPPLINGGQILCGPQFYFRSFKCCVSPESVSSSHLAFLVPL